MIEVVERGIIINNVPSIRIEVIVKDLCTWCEKEAIGCDGENCCCANHSILMTKIRHATIDDQHSHRKRVIENWYLNNNTNPCRCSLCRT